MTTARVCCLTPTASAHDSTPANQQRAENGPDGARERVHGNRGGDKKPDARTESGWEKLRFRDPVARACDGDGSNRTENASDRPADPQSRLPRCVSHDGAECATEATEQTAEDEKKQDFRDRLHLREC